MKQCPKCKRKYDDITLVYCLDDGSTLHDPDATRRFAIPPTEVLPPKPPNHQPKGYDSILRYIVVGLLALIVGGGIVAFLKSGTTTENVGQEDKSNSKSTGGQKVDDKKIQVQLVEEGDSFRIKNIGQRAIDSLKITTYPPPLSNNILLVAYSFSREIGTLEKGSSAVTVKRDELENAQGEILSNSARKVGAILINGRVNGQADGVMFTAQDGKWTPSPPETKWAAVTERLLDQ